MKTWNSRGFKAEPGLMAEIGSGNNHALCINYSNVNKKFITDEEAYKQWHLTKKPSVLGDVKIYIESLDLEGAHICTLFQYSLEK